MSARSRTVDAIFGTLEAFASFYDWVSRLRRVARKEEEPIPLTHRSVENQQAQIRSATQPRK